MEFVKQANSGGMCVGVEKECVARWMEPSEMKLLDF